MADFNFYINRQGIQGRKGDKGDTGFSPTISVGTDTLNEYKLIIANEVNSFETPNLRGNINVLDNGGTYLRYDAETQQISAQGLDAATSTTVGGVLMSTSSDIETMGDNTVITPANLADALPVYLQGEGAVTITQDAETSKTKINVDLSSVDELKSRVSAAEADIVGIQADITNIDADISTLNSVTANHTASISAINNNIADLNNNKVAKTDLATTGTAGIVKVDGTTITVDENGVISSVGGGSTGDVTSDGDNTFTGTNTFNKVVRAVNSNSIIFDDSTYKLELPDGSFIKKGTSGVNRATRTLKPESPDGEIYPRMQVSDVTLDATGDLILKANNNTMPSSVILNYVPKIKDGDGNVMLSQGNVTAGENITLEKTDAGIKISSTASGGGGATIDDNNISTTTVYSSDKTVNLATNLVDNAMITLNQTKQDTLVSGTNIKTINGQSILGEGDITISGGGGEAPTNMVTTDTRQTISEIKTFTNSVPMFFGEANKSNYCGRITQLNTYTSRAITIQGGSDYTHEVGEVKIGHEGNGNYPTMGGVLIKSTPTYDANVDSDIGLKLGSTNDRCSITGNAGQIKLTANAIYPNKGYLKIGGNALTYVDDAGTSHNLLASGGGLTAAQAAHAAMPSNRYVNLTLGASGSTYTAPADGWIELSKVCTAIGQWAYIESRITVGGFGGVIAGYKLYAPVKKGDTFRIIYDLGGKTEIFRFCYAEGSK